MNEQGNRDQLRARIKSYMALPEAEQPQVLPREFGSADGVLNLLRTMVMMLTMILQPSIDGAPHGEILALRIRMFLSALEEFEIPMRRAKEKRKKVQQKEIVCPDNNAPHVNAEVADLTGLENVVGGSKPLWLARFNFVCLLNLPDSIVEFGSVRNYFEGKYLGERYVQEVKAARQRCPPTNITGTLLRRLHEAKAIESLVETQTSAVLKSFRSTENQSEDPRRKMMRGYVRIYKDLDTAVRQWHAYKPISVLETTERGLGILFYSNGCNRGEIKFVQVKSDVQCTSVHDCLRYWQWELTDTVFDFDDCVIKDFVVLLPKIDGKTGEYSTSSFEWSSAMLEHYGYNETGIKKNQVKMVARKREEEGWV